MAEYRRDRVTTITEEIMRAIKPHLKEEPPPQENHHYNRVFEKVHAALSTIERFAQRLG